MKKYTLVFVCMFLFLFATPVYAQEAPPSIFDRLFGTERKAAEANRSAEEIARIEAEAKSNAAINVAQAQAEARKAVAEAEAKAQQAIEQAKLQHANDQLKLKKEIAAITAQRDEATATITNGAKERIAQIEADNKLGIERIRADTEITLAKIIERRTPIIGATIAALMFLACAFFCFWYFFRRTIDTVMPAPKVLPSPRAMLPDSGPITLMIQGPQGQEMGKLLIDQGVKNE